MFRIAALAALLLLTLSAGTVSAQVAPAPGTPLPPNFFPGYSPLVPAINTFPSARSMSTPPPAWSRFRGQTVSPQWMIIPSTPSVVVVPGTTVIPTSSAPVIVTDEVYPARPFRRFFRR